MKGAAERRTSSPPGNYQWCLSTDLELANVSNEDRKRMRPTFPPICPDFSFPFPQEKLNDRRVSLERLFWLFLSFPITDLFLWNVSGSSISAHFKCMSQWHFPGFLSGGHSASLKVSHDQQTVAPFA